MAESSNPVTLMHKIEAVVLFHSLVVIFSHSNLFAPPARYGGARSKSFRNFEGRSQSLFRKDVFVSFLFPRLLGVLSSRLHFTFLFSSPFPFPGFATGRLSQAVCLQCRSKRTTSRPITSPSANPEGRRLVDYDGIGRCLSKAQYAIKRVRRSNSVKYALVYSLETKMARRASVVMQRLTNRK